MLKYVGATDGAADDDLSSNPVILFLDIWDEALGRIKAEFNTLENTNFYRARLADNPCGISGRVLDISKHPEYEDVYEALLTHGDMGTAFFYEEEIPGLQKIKEQADEGIYVGDIELYRPSGIASFYFSGEWDYGTLDVDIRNQYGFPVEVLEGEE